MVHTTSASTSQAATGSAASSPSARRLRAPGWLNGRLVAGLLLVLVSVVLGARIVADADSTDLVWAAEADLAAGTMLIEGDLRAVPVRLADVGGAYLLSSTDPVGRVLNRSIRAGELLPLSVLEETSGLVDIALPIAAGYVPPTLRRGQLVDIYALEPTSIAAQTGIDPAAPEGSGQPDANTVAQVVSIVAQAAVVQLISGRSDGALSVGSATIQVVISVEADQAAALFAAIAGKELVLAVRGSGIAPMDADSDSTSAPDGTPPESTPPAPPVPPATTTPTPTP